VYHWRCVFVLGEDDGLSHLWLDLNARSDPMQESQPYAGDPARGKGSIGESLPGPFGAHTGQVWLEGPATNVRAVPKRAAGYGAVVATKPFADGCISAGEAKSSSCIEPRHGAGHWLHRTEDRF